MDYGYGSFLYNGIFFKAVTGVSMNHYWTSITGNGMTWGVELGYEFEV